MQQPTQTVYVKAHKVQTVKLTLNK